MQLATDRCFEGSILPGLHIITSTKGFTDTKIKLFDSALANTKHFRWVSTELLFHDRRTRFGRSIYNGYPFALFRSDDSLTIVEGIIYNKSSKEIEKELNEIPSGKSAIGNLSAKVKKFLETTDGEFIVMKYNQRDGVLFVFNDPLGRLPFYYSLLSDQYSQEIVMSREINFIASFFGKDELTAPNKMAVAHYLLFGYPLGFETLWEGIKRLPPAAVLSIDFNNSEFTVQKTIAWKLDPNEDNANPPDVKEIARNLASLFTNSLRNSEAALSSEYSEIVSLSGGLDSRAVVSGLVRAGSNPVALSFPAGETDLARKIAEISAVKYGIILSASEMPIEEFFKVFGLMDLRIGRARASFMAGVKEKYPNKAVIYTGDGGDKTVAPFDMSVDRIFSVRELVRNLIDCDHIFSIDEISYALGISSETLYKDLERHILSYPERTIEGKLAHFKVFERGFNWLFIGEDRSRFFMWSTTPFYSTPFFAAAMVIPQKVKKHYVLYKHFLLNLNPELLRIRYYDRFIPFSIPDWILKFYLTIFDLFKKKLYKSGNTAPIDLILGRTAKPAGSEIEYLKRSTLLLLENKDFSPFLKTFETEQLVRKEGDQSKLSILATLILFVGSAHF